MAATVRISDHSRTLLGDLAAETQTPMTEVLDAALELYRRHRFLQLANDAYAAQSDAAQSDIVTELQLLEGTLADGLANYQP